MAEEQSNIKQESNVAKGGMNMDSSVNQIQKGQVSYALNAMVENFDANTFSYQNESGNTLCLTFPEGYVLIGKHFIPEQNKHVFFLVNPVTEDSEIGYMENNDCIYHTLINASCLNFNLDNPIHKVVHKITNCTTEVYWAQRGNPRRFIDLNNLPYKNKEGTNVCDKEFTTEIDCNKLKVQPNFLIPQLSISDVISGGNLTSGTVQFAIQYCDVSGNGYTSYYSVTNPLPIADPQITTLELMYPVGKSVVLDINNIDITGYFQYFNLAVIKTINNIPSVELIGTYFIDNDTKQITYSGQNQTQIKLTIDDIFEKFPYYDEAEDVTAVQDILVWDNLASIDRVNYQKIANQIDLQWQTYRIPNTENYANELNATNLRGYLRDEVYPFEIVFLLNNGKEMDGFHIPGKKISFSELVQPDIPNTNPDFIGEGTSAPYWKIYNTATVLGTDPAYVAHSDYKGPYQYGSFAYWESTELYPCNEEVWGELSGQPIRHHKFPDLNVSPIFENPVIELNGDGTYKNLAIQKDAIFPIGVKVDVNQIETLIAQSNLTKQQKEEIVGFKIVRGNRDVNKSIIGKGILRNVGKYEREGTEYYFPNYPYNDLREDPFLLAQSNAYNSECNTYTFTATSDGTYQYTDCFTNSLKGEPMVNGTDYEICSLTVPTATEGTITTPVQTDTDRYSLHVTNSILNIISGDQEWVIFECTNPDDSTFYKIVYSNEDVVVQVKPSTPPVKFIGTTTKYTITQVNYLINEFCYPSRLSAFETDDSKYRFVFNSPETSFGQPFLGDTLKLENVLFGAGKAHFTEVKKNALYKLLTKEAQEDALTSAAKLADITTDFNATAMFTAYQAYLAIYINGITRQNYGYSYNSILGYSYYADINNGLGVKQRKLDIKQYTTPTVQSVGDDVNLNNYQRESSVYLKTTEDYSALPFPNQTPSLIYGAISRVEDKSRYINSQQDCSQPEKEFDISSVCYYASLKNNVPSQWGQIYSYETIDTGTQVMFSENKSEVTVFGGDTFISQFSFKTKLPFFIDNRVGAPDDSDIYYDEIGNVAYPEYWHSARSILYDRAAADGATKLDNIISIKAHYFDCPNNQLPKPDSSSTPPVTNPSRTYYGGKMYMFAYGIPTFYVESSINVDLRQAFNNREGDFYPHVSTGIPDDWLQESFVPIVQDNTYYYNVTYSKQNKENFFSHLPPNWKDELCYTYFPFRAIYSDSQQSYTDNRINSWLIYRPISYFDFPQNYGNLVSLDGIQNRAILARFENKSLLYDTLLTMDTSNPKAAYIGNGVLFKGSPPVDFAETDLGYVGSQHKLLLKIPQGQITIDAKRGQIFLISGNQATDLGAFGSGVNRFLTDHLAFEILRYFPEVDIDNHYKGIGLHGVYDSKFDRILISKLDYVPISDKVKYDSETREFYIEEEYIQYPVSSTTTSTTTSGEVTTTTSTTTSTTTTIAPVIVKKFIDVTDSEYFCNKSWTLSFNFNTNSWISFHSYIPNWYIAENNFFYSGLNESCDLEAIAAEIVPSTTTTSTTTQGFDCDLTGEARAIECNLEGTAEIIY